MSKLPDGCAVRIDDMAERMDFIRQIKAAGASVGPMTATGEWPIFTLSGSCLSGDSIENCAKNSRLMVMKEQMLAHFGIGVPQMDDVIRVGDRVERNGVDAFFGMSVPVGTKGTVTKVVENRAYADWGNGVKNYDLYLKKLKKIKAGGPASTKQTTTQHGQVSGKSDKGQGGGGGRAIRSDGRRASVATGQRYPGYAKGAHIGEAQSEHAEVRRSIVRGGHH